MLATIEKSKDQFIVVLSKAFCQDNKLKAGDVIEFSKVKPDYSGLKLVGMAERIATMGITGPYEGDDIDWGPDRGEEIIRD